MVLLAETPIPLEEWQITNVGGVTNAVLIVLGVLGLAALVWTWHSLDPTLPLARRMGIMALRAAGLALAICLLLQPTLSRRTLKPAPSSLVVMVDTSGSMTRGSDGSRLDTAAKWLTSREDLFEDLAKNHRLEWYAFAGDLEPIKGPRSLSGKNLPSGSTDMKKSLERAARSSGSDKPAGIILVGDGADTNTLRVAGEPGDLSFAGELQVPINTLAITSSDRQKDLAITGVKVDQFGFSRSDTPVSVILKSVGYGDDPVEVSLWQGGSMISQKEVALVGGEGQANFTVRPSRLGRQVLTASVPVPPGDEIPQNNTVHSSVEVIRDKFRILHLAGHPSWDQRFLRETLEEWPRVDLVSFYVLRTPYQSSTLGSSGLALIPFPTSELFENHLDEFDVVIIQDLEPSQVGLDKYLDEIATWVTDGGGLILMGGEQSFGPSAMSRKPFSDVLPVKLLPGNTPRDRFSDATPFRPKITEAGRRHPVTRLDADEMTNAKLWNSMERLDGIMKTIGTTEKAVTLIEHPTVSVDDGPAPLMSVIEVGKGRSMAITSDSLWRLRFTGPMSGGPADTYQKIWHTAVEWLTRDPELDRLRVKTEPSVVHPGEMMKLEIEQLAESYQPTGGSELTCEISWTDEDGLDQKDSRMVRLDDAGRFRFEWEPQGSGPHQVVLRGEGPLVASDRFLVKSRDVESENLDPDEKLLEALASTSGGRVLSTDAVAADVITVQTKEREVLAREDTPLWNHPAALVIILAILLGEWILRRRLGLN